MTATQARSAGETTVSLSRMPPTGGGITAKGKTTGSGAVKPAQTLPLAPLAETTAFAGAHARQPWRVGRLVVG